MRSLFTHSTTRDDESSLYGILQMDIVRLGSAEFENVLTGSEATPSTIIMVSHFHVRLATISVSHPNRYIYKPLQSPQSTSEFLPAPIRHTNSTHLIDLPSTRTAMKTIISTLIALALFVGPTFVAGGMVRPESGGKGHNSVKEPRQIPALPTFPAVNVNGTGTFSVDSPDCLLIFISPTDGLKSELSCLLNVDLFNFRR